MANQITAASLQSDYDDHFASAGNMVIAIESTLRAIKEATDDR